MSETEKQEGQKTVVAFITGLLVGGLLVWVFSSAPEKPVADTTSDADETEEVKETKSDQETKNGTVTSEQNKPAQKAEVLGAGSLTVSDQNAGYVVTLTDAEYPVASGWIVIRELRDGVPSNVLGAARFSVGEGLRPTAVELQRSTVAGNTYQASFFSDDGDKEFNLRYDLPLDGALTTFTAK